MIAAGPSNFVESVDSAFIFIIAVSVFFLVLITVMMIYFVFRYSSKRNPKAVNVHSNTALEVTWTVIPTLLVLAMFWFGWVGYKEMQAVPDDAMVVDATAQMWKWTFKYENGVQTDTLYVPLNKPVRIDLHSLDVNHAFYIPAFRVKRDVVPNRDNFVWFIGKEAGSFDIACAEYCGLNHSYMYTKVVVISDNDFQFWLTGEAEKLLEKSE